MFSATTAEERAELGDRVTRWLRDHPGVSVTGHRVRQSSNERAHCLSIVLFYRVEARSEHG